MNEIAIVRLQPDMLAIRTAVPETLEVCRQLEPHRRQDMFDNIQIALSEALNNVVEHAFATLPPQEVCIHICANQVQVRLSVVDAGAPLPGGLVPGSDMPALDVDAADLPEGGFGWALIHTLADRIEYERSGGKNHLHLTFS